MMQAPCICGVSASHASVQMPVIALRAQYAEIQRPAVPTNWYELRTALDTVPEVALQAGSMDEGRHQGLMQQYDMKKATRRLLMLMLWSGGRRLKHVLQRNLGEFEFTPVTEAERVHPGARPGGVALMMRQRSHSNKAQSGRFQGVTSFSEVGCGSWQWGWPRPGGTGTCT